MLSINDLALSTNLDSQVLILTFEIWNPLS